jgi:hypothetical protein
VPATGSKKIDTVGRICASKNAGPPACFNSPRRILRKFRNFHL